MPGNVCGPFTEPAVAIHRPDPLRQELALRLLLLVVPILRSYHRALTAREVAGILHLHPVTVYRKAKAHVIPCRFIGSAVRFDPGVVAQWWEESHS